MIKFKDCLKDKYCPICNNKMELILHLGGKNFHSKIINKDLIIFYINSENNDFIPSYLDKILFTNEGFTFSNQSFKDNFIFKNQIKGLVYICCDSILDVDDNIPLHKVCHLSVLDILSTKDTNSLSLDIEISPNLIEETYTITQELDNLTKLFMVSYYYNEKETLFQHYSFTPEQENDDKFEPYTFEKKFNLIIKLDFSSENRNNLLEKFNTWITMS